MNTFKKFFVGLVFVALILTGCGGEEDARFVSEAGAFKVNFVTTPEEQVQSVSTPVGDIEMHMFPDVIGESAIFVVSYGDLPAGFIEGVDMAAFLDSAAVGALQGFGVSEVDIDEEFLLSGKTGLHRRGASADYYADYYNLLAGDRLFQLVYVKQAGFAGDDELDASVGTFELLN